jgi:hypothetical protein
MLRTLATAALMLFLPVTGWAGEKPTTISEFGLTFEVAGAWSRVPNANPDLATYQAKDAPDEITFGPLFKLKKQIEPKSRRSTLAALVKHLKDAERQEMEGKVAFRPVRFSARGGLNIASFTGVDQGRDMLFASMVICSLDNAWTFFYQSLAVSRPAFLLHAERFFASVREIKGPASR